MGGATEVVDGVVEGQRLQTGLPPHLRSTLGQVVSGCRANQGPHWLGDHSRVAVGERGWAEADRSFGGCPGAGWGLLLGAVAFGILQVHQRDAASLRQPSTC